MDDKQSAGNIPSQQHFIAIATDQPIANLPPILQLGRRGDRVTFLSTKQVITKNVPLIVILRDRGFVVHTIELEQENIAAIAAATTTAVALEPTADLIAIINGGKKPWTLAMAGACQISTFIRTCTRW